MVSEQVPQYSKTRTSVQSTNGRWWHWAEVHWQVQVGVNLFEKLGGGERCRCGRCGNEDGMTWGKSAGAAALAASTVDCGLWGLWDRQSLARPCLA